MYGEVLLIRAAEEEEREKGIECGGVYLLQPYGEVNKKLESKGREE